MRRDSRKDTAATGDLAAAHGRTGKVQAIAAASRVPGPPQGALQCRQLNERCGAERRHGAAERTGARVVSRTLLGQGEFDRPGRQIPNDLVARGDRKWRRFLGRIRELAQIRTISMTKDEMRFDRLIDRIDNPFRREAIRPELLSVC